MKHSLYRSRDSYTQVPWAMVEVLEGDVTAAALFDWITWRTEGPSAHVDEEGRRWYVAGRKELSAETNITEKAVRTALKKLVENGHLATEHLKLKGSYDRTTAYAPIWEPLAPEGQWSGPERPMSLAPEGQCSSSDDIEDISLIGDEELPVVKSIDALFDEFWTAYPRKVDKKDAQASFTRIFTKVPPAKREEFAATLRAALVTHVALWKSEQREARVIPHAATWLNKERWTDEVQSASPAEQKPMTVAELRAHREKVMG